MNKENEYEEELEYEEENEYNTRFAKKLLLKSAGDAYCGINGEQWLLDGTYEEEKLLSYALSKVLEEDTGSEKQYLELIGLSYMLDGIARFLKEQDDSKYAGDPIAPPPYLF